jgi:hypothetical protein
MTGGLHTLYARTEPSTDELSKALSITGKRDVVLYKDATCCAEVARWSWWRDHKPRRNQKQVTLNCWPFQLHWLT